MPTYVADIASVLKLRIGVAIALTGVVGLVATPGPAVPGWKVAVLAAAVLLASASAGAFNHLVERTLDARMARTRNRPFVRGAFRAGPLWYGIILALLAAGVGGAAVALGGMAALHVFLGAFIYGVVYTVILKRRTTWNIVVGGLAGSFAVLAGAAVVDPNPGAIPLALALVLFLWTPPHFWSLAMVCGDDYAAAGVPMLPVVVGNRTASRAVLGNTVLLVAASVVPWFFGLGWIYLAGALLGGGLFLQRSIALARSADKATARRTFHASLAQLALLLLGALADRAILG